MYKIKTFNKISKNGLELFPLDKYLIGEDLENYDAILVRSFKLHDLEFPCSLKAIARAGAGVNNIPVEVCSEKGIVVFNTPGANANGVKELVIAGLLLSSRKIVQGIEWAKTLVGNSEVSKLIEKGKSNFVGPEIMGKRLGVIGLGAIGVRVANAADALGMKVSGYDPFISVESAWDLSKTINRANSLEQLISNSDYITLHIPLIPETKNLIDEKVLGMMKIGVRLLNFSRNELIDNEALKQALLDGVVSFYVTDFPNEELIQIENVIAIPHLGASTPESEDNCAVMAVNEIIDYLENGNIINSVNYPNCLMEKSNSLCRIGINHQNIPNMVGQITTVLASQELNIANMINSSKADYAYTLLDVEALPNNQTLDKLRNIKGVIRVRVI